MKLLKGNPHAHVILQIKNTLGERNVHQLEEKSENVVNNKQ
jgi:hypothetical protein